MTGKSINSKNLSLSYIGIFFLFVFLLLTAEISHCARIKDIASIQGARTNQLLGYGVVVGLNGTGDGGQSEFTIQSIVNLMERMGVTVDPKKVKPKNVAAVVVTAQMTPYMKNGQKLDIIVSSMGDAKSLQGGTLLLTPLKGADNNVYALAQGPLSVGGFVAAGGGGKTQKNHPTVGKIPNGATVEREVPFSLDNKEELIINLFNPDFTTISRAVKAINTQMGENIAKAKDAQSIVIDVPDKYKGNIVNLMAEVENLEVEGDQKARIILDERTGTVVIGENVRISKVAVSHGNLTIKIAETAQVSQPTAPLAGGQTAVTSQTDVGVKEEKSGLAILQAGPSIGELVNSLNSVGVSPRDIIAILNTIKAAGALNADLEII